MPVAAATGATPGPTESVQVAAIGWTGCGGTIEGLSAPGTASAACAARGEAVAQSRASAITVTPTLRNTLRLYPLIATRYGLVQRQRARVVGCDARRACCHRSTQRLATPERSPFAHSLRSPPAPRPKRPRHR